MKVHVFKNEDAASLAAAMLICAQILNKPESVIAVENNYDLQSTYEKLQAFYKAGSLAVHNAKFCLASEFCNVGSEQTNAHQLKRMFLQAINLSNENFYNFNLETDNYAQSALQYEQTINDLGGIDLAMLSINENGDVLFNQSAAQLVNDCHFTNLLYERHCSGPSFEPSKLNVQDSIPVMTMGMGTLMRANTILVVAYGQTKAASVANLVRANVSTSCPSTFLQLHKQLVLIIDEAAASLI